MGDPTTPSSSQCPATPVTSPHKAADSKDAVMGVIYSTWKVLHEAEPLDPAVDSEFLIREFLSALHDLRAFSDLVLQTRYTQSCQKAQVHLDSFVQPLWLSWCAELISPERAAAFSVNKELSPPPVAEAFAHTFSDTGEVAASDSPTASTGVDDTLLSVALASFSVVAMPVMASAALGDPVPKFEFQARAANPVTINPPSDSDTAAMEVDSPLATMVNKLPSAHVSETIELSSNNEDDSDSDEVKFIGGTIPNLSSVHLKKGKGRSRKSIKASKMTTTSEDQVSSSLAEAIYRFFGLAHTLPDMPKPDVEFDAEDAPEVVTVKQEKGTAGPSHCKLVIPPPLRDHFDRPPKRPRFEDSDPDDIMMQHTHTDTIVVPSTKVLKPCSSKGKSHAKGSSKVATMKSELIHVLTAVIKPSAASTQLEQMIELSQQLLEENHALRARKS
ncbi:uncharacterized protein LAESUDRAFT_763455 [Laetiporus sulphureus 93-53]|uniref:Uncharacterized protein n=1 Tax=Laetiporus sulphureus 93-53 TaxID=1314785 RepID=A0A165BVB7_9APHY|nr:uncharacterized protein LAESUDRAFT_763455 [Laetiporus sulphureus 93-53]KZT01721.1 hypothetical protein LAESUDRAFT_763455 [Laetiporus sulphureus 93-53]